MSNLKRESLSKCPSNSGSQVRKSEIKLTPIGQLHSRALETTDGTSDEIKIGSTTYLRQHMPGTHSWQVMRHPSFNVDTTQRTVSAQHYGQAFKQKIEIFNDWKMNQYGNGNIKPQMGPMRNLFTVLMTLQEPVLDEILMVIENGKKKRAKDEAKQSYYHHQRKRRGGNRNNVNDDDDDDDDDESDDENKNENSYGLKHRRRHRERHIDFAASVGFRNFFTICRNKYHNRPVAEVYRSAKFAYKHFSPASRYRYRCAQRFNRVAGVPYRHANKYADSDGN